MDLSRSLGIGGGSTISVGIYEEVWDWEYRIGVPDDSGMVL